MRFKPLPRSELRPRIVLCSGVFLLVMTSRERKTDIALAVLAGASIAGIVLIGRVA